MDSNIIKNVTVSFSKILKNCVLLKGMNKFENGDGLMNNIIIMEISVIRCLSFSAYIVICPTNPYSSF